MSKTLTPALNTEVMAAVEEIKAIRALTIQMAQIAEAKIMERLWTIRKEFPDDRAFGDFAAEHIKIDAKTALRYVVTWDGARQNREIRELANAAPDKAMAFVQRLTDGGIGEVIPDDKEVARLLSMPTRKQHQALRELIDTSHAVSEKRHPADRERIKTLEAERDSAVAALQSSNVIELDSHPAAIANGLVDELQVVESTLAALALRAEQCLAGDVPDDVPDSVRDRVVRWSDLASAAIDQITRAAFGSEVISDE